MKVKEFMISNVITAKPDDTLQDVMSLIVHKKIGGMPIVDEEGKLLGMVSDGDILRAIKPRERQIYDFFTFVIYEQKQELEQFLKELGEVSVIKIAKRNGLITVSPEDEMEKVLQLLAKHHFKKLPVVNEEKRVVGVISRGDVIRKIEQTILRQL
ncbi:CBS domain-containing protein [Fictibacillus enclensis]|uniref:CBS domain-containing protein n=1 Tax=Fictibacillus enclensis TaxID=1017270 RepID=UPI0025A25914|nr:CBS domain-containing protein [Fictibacillus enclensis]MDM5336527.1 CBS domain-containing protein [Fictibacillus enclensis]